MDADFINKQQKLLETLNALNANKDSMIAHPGLFNAALKLMAESNKMVLDATTASKESIPLAFTPEGQNILKSVKQAIEQLNHLSKLSAEISNKLQNPDLDEQSYRELENIKLSIAKVMSCAVLEIEKFLKVILTKR